MKIKTPCQPPLHTLLLLTFSGIVLSFFFTLSSCGSKPPDPPELTEAEKVTALLTAGKWAPPAATNWAIVSGVDVSELFKDFTITFTATGFTTTGTTPVWPRTDTWKFKSGSPKILIRTSDAAEFTLETLDEKTLKISLFWNKETTEGGRMSSIIGKHEFTFSK